MAVLFMSSFPFMHSTAAKIAFFWSARTQVHARRFRLAQPGFKVKQALHNGTTNPGPLRRISGNLLPCVGRLSGLPATHAHARTHARPARLQHWCSAGTEAAHTGLYSHRASANCPSRHRPCLLFLTYQTDAAAWIQAVCFSWHCNG